jgi:hypothetical protein
VPGKPGTTTTTQPNPRLRGVRQAAVGSAGLQAALSQAAVSKALLIIGMFIPKLGLVPFLGTTFTAGLATAVVVAVAVWATSGARSHDPISWERATEKNRST